MSRPRTPARRGAIWAVVGGIIVVAAIAAIILSAVTAQAPTTEPSPSSDPRETSAPPATAPPTGEYVDDTASEEGWAPEPITTDPEDYVRAALATASTFDTQLTTRQEWLAYLDTWFTHDTRYTSEADREEDMRASQLELRQGVVLPEDSACVHREGTG
ncbi:hypothetical protein [Microbacterium sp. JZ37]|uniref:hypothetical protein n=1 Tax=Microbacterium sp. JZ37 TaxID=2654193 RepID=UPI002B4A0E27|nr:hypothetical protein [Microbacterium sp. JZ37]WRH18480.1 hypothetical protein GC092_13775 [Microbacterium sp. JZ37]